MSNTNSKTYKANCHCGQIKYTVEVSPPLEEGHEVMSCDCSICTRDGKWNIYIPKEKVQFIQGQDKPKRYDFAKLTHWFCPECGTSLYCHFSDPDHEWFNDWAMNVRAFYDLDLSKLKVKYVSMKSQPPRYDPGW